MKSLQTNFRWLFITEPSFRSLWRVSSEIIWRCSEWNIFAQKNQFLNFRSLQKFSSLNLLLSMNQPDAGEIIQTWRSAVKSWFWTRKSGILARKKSFWVWPRYSVVNSIYTLKVWALGSNGVSRSYGAWTILDMNNYLKITSFLFLLHHHSF